MSDFDLKLTPRSSWRESVNHNSPKALKIRAAVKAIHERGQYPGQQRVMNEIGDPLYRETDRWTTESGESIGVMTRRWMSGRDNAVRKAAMKELGIEVVAGPNDDIAYSSIDYGYGYW